VRVGDLPTVKHATLASFGCTEPFEGWRHGLIGDEELFPKFLNRVDDWRDSPRALRLCYRGLLHAYFQYDVENGATSGARENWGRLRHYLGDRSTSITTPGFQPQWVATLHANPELLGDDPGAFYGAELFRGRVERFERVRAELPVTEASWLVWRVIVGQIGVATAFGDDDFRAAIPRLLDLLTQNPSAKTFGLARVLNRYRQCASPTLHERLRDFAVETWGNPWLSMNEAAWSAVDEGARTMVAEWLKLALMQKFFGLLAKDGVNDMRRLNFWQTFSRDIHAMYFALGESARKHPGPDYRDVRRQMEGLRLTLTHSTDENNAFIMCIGKHVIVEFGETNNACFIFKREGLPFELAGHVAGNFMALKHGSHIERLSHSGPWEEKFRAVLAKVVGVKPEPENRSNVLRASAMAHAGPRPAFVPVVPQPPWFAPSAQKIVDSAPKVHPEPSSAASPTPDAGFNMRDFDIFCKSHRLETEDLREKKGGNLWVLTERQGDEIAQQLSAWGFRFRVMRGWWLSAEASNV